MKRKLILIVLASALVTGCGKHDIDVAADAATEATTDEAPGILEENIDEEERTSYEEAYSGILDVYYYELKNPEAYDTFDIIIKYNDCAVSVYAKSQDENGGAPDYAGYGFYDLDGDGVRELILGNLSDDAGLDKKLYSICGLRRGVPEDKWWCRCADKKKGGVINVEDYAYLREDRKILNEVHEWEGDDHTRTYCLYGVTDNSMYKGLIEGIRIKQKGDAAPTYVKLDKDEKETEISEEEWKAILDEYMSGIVQLELTPFSKYVPKTPEGYHEKDGGWIYGKDFSSWQEGYKTFLTDTDNWYYRDDNDTRAFGFIYVDDDDIPELAIEGNCEADGCEILSYHDGQVSVVSTSRLGFTYIEKTGLLNNSDGHQGLYYDYVYKLSEGRWESVFEGEYKNFDDSVGPEYDEELGRYRTLNYYINDEEVDEKTYLERVYQVYNFNEEKRPEFPMRYDDLMEQLK